MGQVRITGGSHRSRKITVADQPGLRPTADRIRETLFNWLGQNLSGMRVLDLYAGSGILAFESASRHAAQVDCVDLNQQAIRQLQQNRELLAFDNIQVFRQSAVEFLQHVREPYDLLLLDPPFDSEEMNRISVIIADQVRSTGMVYREYGVNQDITPMNEQSWTLLKQKTAGQVCFELWQKND